MKNVPLKADAPSSAIEMPDPAMSVIIPFESTFLTF